MDKREYSKERITANPTDSIISIVLMMRGHEESATKSRRLIDAYERKRNEAAAGAARHPFTRMLPAWLRWNAEAHAYVVIPDRAAVIQSIFKKANHGAGQHRIAQWLNEQGTPTWGGLGKQRRAEVLPVPTFVSY